MFLRNLFFIFIIIYNAISYATTEVNTENTGEKAMIVSLRKIVDQDPILKASGIEIVIGSGVSGCDAFKASNTTKMVRVLLTWQWLDALDSISKDTIVVAPNHAIDKRFLALEKSGVRLIKISGVLHAKTIDNIKMESTSEIDPRTEYVVMLAGDVQKEDGSWESYNKDMLSEFLKDLPKDKFILILNGPRTGKHLENSNQIDNFSHRTGTDYITKSVIYEGVENWKIVDFKYGKKSLWDSALKYCTDHTDVGLILPGESTSMISEALSLGIRPIVYRNPIMTDGSSNYVKQLLNEDKILQFPIWDRKIFKQQPLEDQRKNIIKSLIVHLNLHTD